MRHADERPCRAAGGMPGQTPARVPRCQRRALVAVRRAAIYIAHMTGIAALREFIGHHRSLLVLTGAGCSTNSGIPDYRDVDGTWKRARPMTFQAFMASECARRRYWAKGAWSAGGGSAPRGPTEHMPRLSGWKRWAAASCF